MTRRVPVYRHIARIYNRISLVAEQPVVRDRDGNEQLHGDERSWG